MNFETECYSMLEVHSHIALNQSLHTCTVHALHNHNGHALKMPGSVLDKRTRLPPRVLAINVTVANVFLITCIQEHDVSAMGIDITQWRIQIARYWRYAGRRRHSRRKTRGVKTASATTCSPLLVLMSFCLITAPSLLLVAGDVERNPGPPKSKCDSRE